VTRDGVTRDDVIRDDVTREDFDGDNEETRAHPPAPPAGSVRFEPDAGRHPQAGRTVTTPGARRRLWLGLAVGCLALVTLVGVARWYATHGALSNQQSPPAKPSRPVAGSAGGVAGGSCGLTTSAPDLRCPAAPECFGPVSVDGGVARAASTACDGPHTSEVFALGALPAGVTSVDYRKIKNDPHVRSVCNADTLARVDVESVAWRVDVLPPAPDAFSSGDRTFRCLAGPAAGTSAGSKFVRVGR
jgi:hypothetical protein